MRTIDADQLSGQPRPASCVGCATTAPAPGPRLAAELGLTRSAVSTLVAELAERGLVRTGGDRARRGRSPRHHGRARRPRGLPAWAPRSTSTTSRPWPSTCPARWSASTGSASTRATSSRPRRCSTGSSSWSARPWPTWPTATSSRSGSPSASPAWSTATATSSPTGPTSAGATCPVGDLLRERLGAPYPITVDNEGNLAAMAEATPGDPRPPGHPGDLRRGRRRRRDRRRRAGCCADGRATPASSAT